MKDIKSQLFNTLYIMLCFASMYFIVEDDKQTQLYVKPFTSIALCSFYLTSVKKVNVFYLLMFPFLLIAHVLIIDYKQYFVYCIYCYMIVNILNTLLVYKNHLTKKSVFNIFTFTLPFFMAFVTVFILISDKIEKPLLPPVFMFIITACISGAIVLLNYSQIQCIGNYLIFLGTFTIISCYACATIYMFGNNEELYYQLLNLFEYLGQYALCRGLIIKQEVKQYS